MPGMTTAGAAVRGIASAVPARKQTVEDLGRLFGAEAAEKIAQSAGVRVRRVAQPGVCCSDLCFAAAESLLKSAQWDKNAVDSFFFHQANKFMLEYLAKRMGLPPTKVPIVLEHYGNTSVASIPLAITHCARQHLEKQKMKLVLAGFGVGFSWAAAAVEVGPIVAPELQEVP